MKQKAFWMRGLILLSLIAGSSLIFATPAKAVEIVNGATVPADQVIDDDVFITGENVVIDGVINGNLFASGQRVAINGRVKGSVFMAANGLVLNGKVDGSVFAAGYSILIKEAAQVDRNLIAAGFSLETKPGSEVAKDLIVAAYQAVLSGQVDRDVKAGAAALEINGTVQRNVLAEVGTPGDRPPDMKAFYNSPDAPAMIPPGLRIGDTAKIMGELTYRSEKSQSQAIQATPVGGVIYLTPQPSQKPAQPAKTVPASLETIAGSYFLHLIQNILTLALLGGLVVWLMPGFLQSISSLVGEKPLASGLNGVLVTVIGYAGALLLAITMLILAILFWVVRLGGVGNAIFGVGFSSLGLALALLGFGLSFGSKIVVAAFAGNLLCERFIPNLAGRKFWSLLVGVLVYALLRSIPILGWLVGLGVTLVGLGAIYEVVKGRYFPKPAVVAVS